MKKFLLSAIVAAATAFNANSQCNFIPSTSTMTDTLSYSFSGGSFGSYGCAPIDPTYWLAGNLNSVTITFVNPQSNPSFRVWGMNDDDTAFVNVNGARYPLDASSASYDTKVVCGISPGPDGVIFTGGNLVGANSNNQGNYSYQNIQLNAANVSSITITAVTGAGWGFAGVTVCNTATSVNDPTTDRKGIGVYPIPTNNIISFSAQTNLQLANIKGQIVAEKINVKSLDISDQPAGIYFLILTDEQGQVVQRTKIVKE